MSGSDVTRLRFFPIGVTLGVLLCVAGGMGGGTCIPQPGNNNNNNANSNSSPSLIPTPPATQANAGGSSNSPPIVTFGWPTAPVSIAAGTAVTIQWSVSDPEDAARVSILAVDGAGNTIIIKSGAVGIPPLSSDVVVWDTTSTAIGDYRIEALATDGTNPTVSIFAPGIISIIPRSPPPTQPPPAPPPPNTPPTLNFSSPIANTNIDAGQVFTIAWRTQDFEDKVTVTIAVDADSNDSNTNEIILVTRQEALSKAPVLDSFAWNTGGVTLANYRVIGTVDDGSTNTGHRIRVVAPGVVNVHSPGTGGVTNSPPTLAVTAPTTDVGVAQGDQFLVALQVSDPDGDSNGLMRDTITLTYYFDRDNDPTNDAADPPIKIGSDAISAARLLPPPVAGALINLTSNCTTNAGFALFACIIIDTTVIPVRAETDAGGRPLPYFFRIKADDGHSGVVDSYAAGTVRVLGSASDVVDLQLVGGAVSGVRLQGFNGDPCGEARGSRAGSAFAAMGDVDTDGIADFAIASGTGTPVNADNVGMAFLIYGRDNVSGGRYAGIINLNTVGTLSPTSSGVFVVRGTQLYHPDADPGSKGISSMVAWPDLTTNRSAALVIGAPQDLSVRDLRDDDPCDLCEFPAPPAPNSIGTISCMVTPTIQTDITGPIANIDGIPVAGGTWWGANGAGDDPKNAPPLVPNVNMTLPGTILKLSQLRVRLHGAGVDGPVGGNPHPVSFTVKVRLEYNANIANTNAQMTGPEASGTITGDANSDGSFTFGTGDTSSNGLDIKFLPGTPEFPVITAAPQPAPNTSPITIPPSVYDGVFNVLIQPSHAITFDAGSTIHIAATTVSQERHGFAFYYRNAGGFRDVFGRTLFLDDDTFPNAQPNGFGNPEGFLNAGCADITPKSADRIAMLEFPPAPPPLNDDRFSDVDSSGYLCTQIPTGGANTIVNPDALFGRTSLGGSVNQGSKYTSGLVFVCAMDDIRLDRDTNGLWTGAGQPVAGIGDFGQGALTPNWRGCRFRGAWYQYNNVSSNGNIDESGVYDPTSLFGQTVDTIPDIDALPAGQNPKLRELIVSAPAGRRTAIGTLDLTATFSSASPNPAWAIGDVRETTYNLTGGVLDPSSLVLPNTQFDEVLSAYLTIAGTATRAARVQVELIDDNTLFPIAGTQKVLELWPGDADSNADWEFPEYFNASFSFPNPMFSQPDRRVHSDLMNFPRSALPFMTQFNSAGRVRVRLTMLNPTTFVNGNAGVIDSATLSITSAVLTVMGTVSDYGQVIVFQGRDWTSALFETADEPRSWPGFTCEPNLTRGMDDTANQNVRGRKYVTRLIGEAPGDQLGWAHDAGDVNQDGVHDLILGEPGSDNNPFRSQTTKNDGFGGSGASTNNGKAMVIYGTPVLGSGTVGHPFERFEVRGTHDNDAFGKVQGGAGKFGGDSSDDCFFAASSYDNDGKIAGVAATGTDAGLVSVLFGSRGSELTGEHTVPCESIGTTSFPGCKFVGGFSGALLGDAVGSAGDFNHDGNDDLLITAPGQQWPGAKLAFFGPVADGETITVNGTVFEFDTNKSVAAGSVRVDVSLGTSATNAEAAFRSALQSVSPVTLGVSNIFSQSQFPAPLPSVPTTQFLARQPGTFLVFTAAANVQLTTFVRQGATYLIFGSNGSALLNKTFILPNDMNRVAGGVRVLKGIAFVSGYERNDPRDSNDPEGVDAGSLTIDFEAGGVPLNGSGSVLNSNGVPYVTFSPASGQQTIANANLRASGTKGYAVQVGADAVITFTEPLYEVQTYFSFDNALATSATISTLDASGFVIDTQNAVDATTSNVTNIVGGLVQFCSQAAIAQIRVHVNGLAGGIAVLDNFKFNDPSPDEAPVEVVGAIGDVDHDGFPDIILGAPRADFINIAEPGQRRKSAGEAYIVYGNNFGLSNPNTP